jgi:hypothetical protein
VFCSPNRWTKPGLERCMRLYILCSIRRRHACMSPTWWDAACMCSNTPIRTAIRRIFLDVLQKAKENMRSQHNSTTNLAFLVPLQQPLHIYSCRPCHLGHLYSRIMLFSRARPTQALIRPLLCQSVHHQCARRNLLFRICKRRLAAGLEQNAVQ